MVPRVSLAWLIIVLLSDHALAAIYYVSPSGDDSNAGTSPTLPFRSLARASFPNLGLHPGDALLLERGGVWSDEALSLAFAAGVEVGGYGNVSLPRPVIQQSIPAANSPRACLTVLQPEDIVIAGLHFAG